MESKTIFQKYPLLGAVTLSLLTIGFATSFLHPVYQTIDDIATALTLSGSLYTDKPSAFTMWSPILLTTFLKQLYIWLPQWPWYALYFYTGYFVVISALTYLVFRNCRHYWPGILWIFGVISVFIPFLVELQFTPFSFLLAATGCWWMIGQQGKSWLRIYPVAFLVIFLGALLRLEAAILAIMISIPFLLYDAWENRSGKLLWRYGLFTGICLAGMAGLFYQNLHAYEQEKGWEDFYAMDLVKKKLTDYRRLDYNAGHQAIYDRVGWSENDFQMYVNWFFVDEELYGRENLEQLSLETGWLRNDLSMHYLIAFLKSLGKSSVVIPVLGFWLFLLLLAPKGPQFYRRQWIAWTLSILCLLLFLLAFKLPKRLFEPLLLPPLLVAFLHLDLGAAWDDLSHRRDFKIGVSLLFAGVLALQVWQWHQGSERFQRSDQLHQAIKALQPKQDQYFINWGNCFPIQSLLALKHRPINMQYLPVGSRTYTPMVRDKLKAWSIDDLYVDMVDAPNIFLISNPKLNALLHQYLVEHYGIPITFKTYYTFPDLRLNIYRVAHRAVY